MIAIFILTILGSVATVGCILAVAIIAARFLTYFTEE